MLGMMGTRGAGEEKTLAAGRSERVGRGYKGGGRRGVLCDQRDKALQPCVSGTKIDRLD
jgi:hypothetical protein